MRICIFADVHANFEALKAVLFDAQSEMLDGYKTLRENLGEPGVTQRAAKEILDFAEK